MWSGSDSSNGGLGCLESVYRSIQVTLCSLQGTPTPVFIQALCMLSPSTFILSILSILSLYSLSSSSLLSPIHIDPLFRGCPDILPTQQHSIDAIYRNSSIIIRINSFRMSIFISSTLPSLPRTPYSTLTSDFSQLTRRTTTTTIRTAYYVLLDLAKATPYE